MTCTSSPFFQPTVSFAAAAAGIAAKVIHSCNIALATDFAYESYSIRFQHIPRKEQLN